MVEGPELHELYQAIRESWSEMTACEPKEWSEHNPAYSQCAVTAMVVQDYLGGEIDWVQVEIGEKEGSEKYFEEGNRISHYYNRVEGDRIDFTFQQFPEGCTRHVDSEVLEEKYGNADTIREYIEISPFIMRRYNRLKEEVARRLEE